MRVHPIGSQARIDHAAAEHRSLIPVAVYPKLFLIGGSAV